MTSPAAYTTQGGRLAAWPQTNKSVQQKDRQQLEQPVMNGDFGALEKKGSDFVTDENSQKDKQSTMANTMTYDMNSPSGFKNIQDYLQEANLYSATKPESMSTQWAIDEEKSLRITNQPNS